MRGLLFAQHFVDPLELDVLVLDQVGLLFELTFEGFVLQPLDPNLPFELVNLHVFRELLLLLLPEVDIRLLFLLECFYSSLDHREHVRLSDGQLQASLVLVTLLLIELAC